MHLPTTLISAGLRAAYCFIGLLIVTVGGDGPRAQTIFDDDFDRAQLGAFWNGNGGWTIRDGQAYNGVDDDWTLLTTTQSFPDTSYVLETKVFGLVDGYQRAYYLLFGQQRDGGEPGYVVRYDPLGAGSLILGEATTNYLYPTLLDRKIIQLDPTRAYTLRVAKYDNGLIQVYLGDDSGFPELPTLEAVSTTFPSLSKVSWTTFTQSVGEEFFVDYLRATVPAVQKTEREKPAADELVAEIVTTSKGAYLLSRLTAGETFYTDRPYTLTGVPDFLEGARFIKTANDDKRSSSSNLLTAFLTQRAIAYVAFDPRASVLPDWLQDWTKTGEVIGTTDPGTPYLEVYSKLASFAIFSPTPYLVQLGGALALPAAGANANYIVALVPVESSYRYEAEDALLSGVRPAYDHDGYSGSGFADYLLPTEDYIEWTVDVPATSPYNLLARYANGSTAARTLELSVDGKVLSAASFQPTGGWKNWSTRTLGESVLLTAGTHRIRLTATGTSGPNLDYLDLSPTSVYTPPSGGLARTLALPPQGALYSSELAAPTCSVYPNPTSSTLTLSWPAGAGGTEVQITDMRGRVVYRQLVADPSRLAGTDRLRMDLKNWSAGTYVYRIVTGGQLLTGKFVKTD